MTLQTLRAIARAVDDALSPKRIAEVVVQNTTEKFGAAASAVYLADGPRQARLAACRGFEQADLAQLAILPLTSEVPLAVAMRCAEPVWCEDRATLLERFPAVRERRFPASQLQSAFAVPFCIDQRVVGGLALGFASSRRLDELEREVLSTIGDLSAHAIERFRLEESLRFLAEASAALANSLDYETTLASVAKLAVPTIADWATVDMLKPDGSLKRLAVAHVDPTKIALAQELSKRLPFNRNAPRGVASVVRTGKPEFLPEIDDSLLETRVSDPETRAIVRSLGLSSSVSVPLRGRRGVVGVFSVCFAESGRRYSEDDLHVLEDLGRRASLAIENAMLYRAMEEANQEKDAFLAVVSHELRTPLHAILGWAHLLRQGDLPEERRIKGLETIERNARAQNQLIDDLLDVSRIVSGKLRLDTESVDLMQIIERASDTVRPAAAPKNIVIRQMLDPSASMVHGDAGRLQQVVGNLLTNAVKFSADGAEVHVALRKVDSAAELSVRDNGVGIDPSFLPHVFERFRQADARRSREKGGLGVGLAIVRNLVELHGGTVRAASDGIGRGSTFTVRLPLAVVHAPSFARPPALQLAALIPTPERYPARAGLRVLVVDDEADARDLLSELLAASGVVVSTAGSVREGLERFKAARADIVISDIGMPGADGHELIKAIRQLPLDQGGHVPAVALTAYARAEERTKALVSGFTIHVAKPVEPNEFLAALASLTTLLERP